MDRRPGHRRATASGGRGRAALDRGVGREGRRRLRRIPAQDRTRPDQPGLEGLVRRRPAPRRGAGAPAHRVARTLMSEASWSGWGVRTLAKGQRAYNPLSYHNGTVWPHDNSLIAMGFSNYGLQKLAAQVLTGQYDACRQFRHSRLPELF